MKKKMISLALLIALGGSASAQTEVRWLWSDHLPELYDSHNAAWETPVSLPPGAVHWKYDRGEAQAMNRKLFDRTRRVVQPIEVVRTPDARHPEQQNSTVYTYSQGDNQ